MNRQQNARENGGAARRWSPSPLLYASAAVHLGAAAALLARPRAWPWALGAVIANHVGLAAAGLWPRSRLLGPNWTRLPAQGGAAAGVAITIDDGPDPDVTPQVLSQLATHGAHATFFCVGVRVERYPDLKSNQNFLTLQSQLEGTENRIAVERMRYSEAVRDYNTRLRLFPGSVVASLRGFKEKAYFEAAPGSQEAPKVKF